MSCPVTVTVTVVIATRNRCPSLRHTLTMLQALPERPPVIVVDNGSADGTPAAVRRHHPRVRLIELPHNRGALARNVGVDAAETPYVAFADDDSWWDPGALRRAADVLAGDSRLAAVIGKVLLHPTGEVDRVSRKLARDRLGSMPGLPGPRALSFPAFAAVLRRDAFAQVGGFSPLLFFGGEEQLLAADLAAAGWELCYLDDVVARHEPGNPAVSPQRWAQQTRNDVLVLWLRRPLARAAARTVALAVRGLVNRAAAVAAGGVLVRLPAALRQRRAVPAELDAQLSIADHGD
jgi:GT2 family glycosyltransferase